ncbi:MAG: PKD domain-containing protein [Flavobacteriia bacterium]|nr:PKD domain-containing protein [Flavobacteriia bacterium]
MMHKNITIIFFLCTSFLFSQDSLSVLFIGNSYTYVNDLPGTLSNLTTSLGDEITYDSQAIGGASFQTHAGLASTYTKIHSQPWDFVVLQGQSQEPSFPYDQVNTSTIPYAIQLADSVYANKFCSEVMLYMTWGREVGDPQWDSINTFDKMNGRLRDAYIRIMDSVQGCMSAGGSAWKYVRDHYPTINLYSSDGSHPSVEGTYLIACTFYASLFRKSPVGATYISSVSPANATILQNAAALTVLDSLEFWNLRPLSELTQASYTYTQQNEIVSFVNSSIKADTYQWNFGDGTFSTAENPQHSFTQNGTYSVELIASSSCDSDSMSVDVIINTFQSGIDEKLALLMKLIDGDNGKFRVSFDEKQRGSYFVCNLLGQKIDEGFFHSKDLEIDLNFQNNGIYLLKIEIDNQLYNIRIVKK